MLFANTFEYIYYIFQWFPRTKTSLKFGSLQVSTNHIETDGVIIRYDITVKEVVTEAEYANVTTVTEASAEYANVAVTDKNKVSKDENMKWLSFFFPCFK